MTRFDYINENIDRIKLEIKAGLIPPSVLRNFEIYSRYDYYRKLGNKSMISLLYASEDLKATEIQVFRAKKQMEANL